MLINRQKIVAICDICGFEIIMYDEEIPEGGDFIKPYTPEHWITFGEKLICGQHRELSIRVEVGKEIIIEDNSGSRLSLKS
jgi:hypothetical protein